MTTHRRAWMTRAGVVVALAASALVAAPASPALADPPTVQITDLSSGTLSPGQRATLTFEVKNRHAGGLVGGGPEKDTITINVRASFPELGCEGPCDTTQSFKADETKRFTVTLIAGNVAAGQTKSGKVEIRAQGAASGGAGAERAITVKGPEQEKTVKSISGKVTDIDNGDPISGATVAMSDSKNHRYTTTTNDNGTYRFTSSEGEPISPGEILIAAQADKYKQSEPKRINGVAGQAMSGPTLALKAEAAPTPSATPSATAEPTAEATPGAEETTAPAAAPATENASDSGGLGSWLLIIVGGLLVALGVGAIVLLLVRRKENEADEEGADDATAGAGSGGYRGGNDATRVANAGGPGDATMVTSGSLADAPTMLHHMPPIDDEYPDPYGAPLPAAQPGGAQSPAFGGGYGAGAPTQAGYGADATSAYGGAPTQAGYGASDATSVYGGGPAGGAYGNAPSSGGGYGAPAGGPNNAYGAPPTPAGGYGAPGGPGNAPASGGGYGGPGGPGGPANGYGNAPSSGGGYGAPAGPAGRAPGGEGYGGHEYAPPAGQPGPGYGAPQGGYGERYDEPTGRYEGGGNPYARPAAPYEPGPYGQDGAPGRGGYNQEQGYGAPAGGYDAPGGYAQGGGGYDNPSAGSGYESGAGYGAAPGGYGPGYGGGAPNGYDQRGGADQRGGYDGPAGQDRVPDQRGGYGERGYDQGGYYDDPAQSGQSRHGGPQQPGRSERRSLDWLDD